MSDHVARTLVGIDATTTEAGERFAVLGGGQLNWQPEPGRWSVAQCLDHLAVSERLYLPVFAAIAAGTHRRPAWALVPGLARGWGRFLRSAVDPANAARGRSPARFAPAASALPADIVGAFIAHSATLRAAVGGLAGADPATAIASPAAGFVVYGLGDALDIIVLHRRRHLAQARRVAAEPGFPR